MFTRKLAKIIGTLKKNEYEMYDEQRLNNPGKYIDKRLFFNMLR